VYPRRPTGKKLAGAIAIKWNQRLLGLLPRALPINQKIPRLTGTQNRTAVFKGTLNRGPLGGEGGNVAGIYQENLP
jgi:hypothetical protein